MSPEPALAMSRVLLFMPYGVDATLEYMPGKPYLYVLFWEREERYM